MLTFFPREWNVFRSLPLPSPEMVMMRVFYMRASCMLSQQRRKVIFCRDSDLPSYRFKCLRAACFSSDVDEQNMCGDMCKRTVALLYFIGLRVFCRAYAYTVS
jgi:hypothetical protein